MSRVKSLLTPEFCFRVYRSAAMFSKSLDRKGFYRLADAVYWFLPLKLCNVGYEVWSELHREDFEAHLERCKS